MEKRKHNVLQELCAAANAIYYKKCAITLYERNADFHDCEKKKNCETYTVLCYVIVIG